MAPARYIWIFAVFAVCFANHVKARSAVIGNESLPLAARAKRGAVVRGSFAAWFFGDEPGIGESPREFGAESGAVERVSRCKRQVPNGGTACSQAVLRETSFIDGPHPSWPDPEEGRSRAYGITKFPKQTKECDVRGVELSLTFNKSELLLNYSFNKQWLIKPSKANDISSDRLGFIVLPFRTNRLWGVEVIDDSKDRRSFTVGFSTRHWNSRLVVKPSSAFMKQLCNSPEGIQGNFYKVRNDRVKLNDKIIAQPPVQEGSFRRHGFRGSRRRHSSFRGRNSACGTSGGRSSSPI